VAIPRPAGRLDINLLERRPVAHVAPQYDFQLFAEACISTLRLLRQLRVCESDDLVAALEQRLGY
jgi:hypothetical protein